MSVRKLISQKFIITSSLSSKLRDYIEKPAFFEKWYANDGFSDSMWEDYVEVIEDDEEATKENAREVFEEYLEEFLHSFPSDSGSLTVWRCLSVKDVKSFIKNLKAGNYEKGYTGLGEYWSFDKDLSECHWGDKKHSITLEGEVKATAVDIEKTAWAVMNLSTGREEAEVNLKKGSSILLTKIEFENKNILDKPIKLKI